MKRLFVTLLIMSVFVQAKADNYYGKRIGIENGLSQSSVTSMVYDNNGALWIGTRFGLNEYRNGKIKSFLDSRINGLYCDGKDRIWALTADGALLYDKTTDSFKTVYNQPANCIFEMDGTVFIGGNYGIVRYRESDETLMPENSTEWTDFVRFLRYEDTLICIDRRKGISIIGKNGKETLSIPQLQGKTVMAACMIDSRLFLSILGEGLLVYDMEKRTESAFLKQGENGLGRDLVLYLEIIEGKIWLGTDGGGTLILDPDTFRIETLTSSIALNPGTELPSSVTSIYEDPLGNIWIGGVYFGVTGLKRASVDSYLPGLTVNNLYCSSDGCVYVGTDGNGLFRYYGGMLEQIGATSGMKITSSADYDGTRLVFCAYNRGFFILNKSECTISPLIIKDPVTNAQECLNGNSPEVCNLDNGKLLIFAVNNYILDPATATFTLMKDSSNEIARDLHTITGAGHDQYAYCMNGIFKIDLNNACLDLIFKPENESDLINALVFSGDKFLIGTDHGLLSFDPGSRAVIHLRNALFKRVTELCAGIEGKTWIGADNALFVYSDGAIDIVGEDKGVAANEITTSSIDKEGSIYLGGSDGFMVMNNQEVLFHSDTAPEKKLSLHDVTSGGNKIDCRNGKVRLPYNSGLLSVTVSLSDSDPLEKTVYRFSVDGATAYSQESFDDNLKMPGLKSGFYSIKTSYLKNHGRWSSPEKILEVRILRPWYKSALMIVFYILLTAAVLTRIIQYLRKKMLEDLQAQMRAKDIQFTTKFENYIRENLSDCNLNVEGVANAMAMSRASLYSKVKATYAMGIGEYIEMKRIGMAKDLLSSTDLSVTEIADKVGYSTPRYFSTRFKLLEGESPLGYRKKFRG